MSPPRCLIVKLSSFGDIVHALPLADALRAAWPDAHLGWAVQSKLAHLLDGNPNLDVVHKLERKTLAEALRVGRGLRGENYDLALDAQGLFFSGLVTRLSGAPRRIGYDWRREANQLFLTDATVPATDRAHMAEKVLRFCDALGILRPTPLPQTYLAGPERDNARALFAAIPAGLCPIGVVLGASTVAKTLSPARWRGLLGGFHERGWHPVLIGGPAEASVSEALHAIPSLDLVGKTPFRLLASVLEQCATVVGGDTGSLHLAVAVGTPVVGLYGVTDPVRTGPAWGAAPAIVLDRAGDDPTARRYRKVATSEVIERIGDDEILDALARQIGGKQ